MNPIHQNRRALSATEIVTQLTQLNGDAAQGRKHVFVEDALDLRQRALPTLLQFQPAVREPLQIHRLEAVLARQTDSAELVLAVDFGVNAFGGQSLAFVGLEPVVFARHAPTPFNLSLLCVK